MKEEIKGDDELREAFAGETAADVLRGARSDRARAAVRRATGSSPYQQEFGYKAIWSHEFVFPTWRENPAPIIEAIRGYLETDYDYPAAIAAVKEDLEGAVARAHGRGAGGRGSRQPPGRARPVAADEPADARPPLLHRPGHERAAPARR